jgi:TonB family protein
MTASFILNHLWQSTLCVAAAALLVWLLKDQPARWRYRVWLAASLKFFVPFALLGALGSQIPVRVFTPDAPKSSVSVVVEFLGEPFDFAQREPNGPRPSGFGTRQDPSDFTSPEARVPRPESALAPIVLLSLWLGGCLALLVGKAIRWRQLRSLLLTARSLNRGREADALERTQARLVSGRAIEVCALPSAVEPGVVGIRKPIILWPMALSARLNDRELDAIFAHELQHVHRRDNLAAALHGILEIALWFHPAIWWIKSRLVAERERACDEAVLQLGSEPDAYARGILKVCEFCLQTPSIAAAAVTGADLTRRMEDIMSDRKTSSLTLGHKLLLGLTALGIIVVPIVSGSLQASPMTTPSTPQPGTWQAAAVSVLTPFGVVVPEPAVQSTGRVTGTVTDVRGAGIAGAKIAVSPSGGGAGTETNANGGYSLDLQPGQYELTISKPGFAQSKATLFVSRGVALERNVRLSMGSVAETVNVTGQGAPPSTMSLETAAEVIDRAKSLLQQGRLLEAEGDLNRASAAIRAARMRAAGGTTSNPPLASGSAVRVGGEVREPRKITSVDPIYPPVARAAGISGIVIIDALIGADGRPRDLRILRGQQLLNQAALDAVSQWVFTPTELNGVPVEVMMTVTVNFQLPKPPEPQQQPQ